MVCRWLGLAVAVACGGGRLAGRRIATRITPLQRAGPGSGCDLTGAPFYAPATNHLWDGVRERLLLLKNLPRNTQFE